MIRSLILLFLCAGYFHSAAQETAKGILEKSITYHDPKGILSKEHVTLELLGSRPNGPDQTTTVFLHQSKQEVSIKNMQDDYEIEMQKSGDQVIFTVDGRKDLTEEEITKYRLTAERLDLMKNYYRYLWLAPLVLHDPGTILHDKVSRKDFFGKDALELKITYDPTVGEDIWYFYFDTKTYAMVGYRFYHDETANDGEYILLSEEINYKSVRIPKNRKWYTHKEDKFLGEDRLLDFKVH